MSTYVMSDLHGQQALFFEMLELIQFKEEDTLYIIGDAVDRGNDGISLLTYFMNEPNIVFLLGNHEKMMLDCYERGMIPLSTAWQRWNRNKNQPTIEAFESLNQEEQKRLLDFIEAAPAELKVEVNNQTFHLVHGAPCDKAGFVADRIYESYETFLVWNRLKGDETFEGAKVIVGHTPTAYYQSGKPLKMWHGNNVIDIDCGCAMLDSGGRLGCLRLDDMKEFYVG